MTNPLNPTLDRLRSLCRMDRTWVKGEGVWLWDNEGRRFLDCYAQYGAVAFGHNAPVVAAAVRAALDGSEPAMVQPYNAPHAEALARELTRLAPGHLARCTFTTSGAETVEAAIKLVRARTGRPIILSATGGFHGKTLGALSATDVRHGSSLFGPRPDGFERVRFGDIEALRERFERDGDRIAAFLIEPVQGERGVFLPPPGYLRQARDVCSQYGAALVFDEIQTGLGRTGRLFACEHDDVSPDLLLLAKGLGGGLFPLGACLCSAEFWDERFALTHSSTFANNNVACRAGLAVLNQLTSGEFCLKVARQGDYLMSRLHRIAARYSNVIREVRGRGLLAAIELQRPDVEDSALLSYMQHQGFYAYAVASAIAEYASVLVVPALGDSNVLRIVPPLVIEDNDLDFALDGIERVCGMLDRNAAETIVRGIGAIDEDGRVDTRSAEAPLFMPPVQHRQHVDYAFLIHYTSPEDVATTEPWLRHLTPDELSRFCDYTSQLPAGVMMQAPAIRSETGACAEGVILALPLLPDEMARRGVTRVRQEIVRAVDLAASLGAKIIGLGGYTTAYSARGAAVTGRGIAVTTGNALTAGMAFSSAREMLERKGLALHQAAVAVVGARGSVGALCARLFAREHPRRLVLIGNPTSGLTRLQRFAGDLRLTNGNIFIELGGLEALAGCDLILTATGAGHPILDNAPISPGAIVCDVARPQDTSAAMRSRGDITVIDGGLVALPDSRIRFGGGNLQGFPDGVQLACLSETILLALEGETRDRSIGNDISVREADDMMALAARHGFRSTFEVREACRL